MNKEQKKLMLTAIIVLLAISTMGYFCNQAVKKRQIAKQTLLAEEATLASMMVKIRKIPRLKQEINNLKDKIAFYEHSLPSDKEVEETLKLIQELLVQTDISIKVLTPSKTFVGRRVATRSNGPYTKHQFKLVLNGTYHQIARFISGLEHLQRFTSIENMIMKKGSKNILNINMTIVTYSFKGSRI